ncbi:cytochrome P450 [Crossiella cryophila]|uniref:Cytochrome P450 n=1 Tax=Crossiella cryophila TaxID=43355 RepID=A0A7W7C7S1_9PSEU|nr:cytochrome P450 [Crossiella cryophila]MBB4676046.1 cytochrome P450 [Crossiella cryophila]
MNNLGPAASLRLGSQIQAAKATNWLLGGLGDLLVQVENPKWRENPYPLYEQIRQKGPLYRGLSGTWATTSHALCNQVLRDRRFGVKNADGSPVTGGALGAVANTYPESFLDQDPPDHTRLRRLAAPAFNPKRVDGYRPRVQQIVDSLLDKIEGQETFDLIKDLAAPLPITVISDLLGIPDADRGDFAEYGARIGEGLSGVHSIRQAKDLIHVGSELVALFDRLLKERTKDPGDDVISSLATAVGEEKMTARELHGTAMLLLLAGFETTVNLIGNGVHALLAHPEQWAQLRDKPELAAAMTEEALRYDPPVQATMRIAHADIELAGETIKSGQLVGVMLAAGNRDPEVYPEPDKFDITRTGGPEHLAFSSGIHYCIGARLARIEGEILFRSLAERMPLLRQAGPLERRESSTIRGLRAFPVTAKFPAQRSQ